MFATVALVALVVTAPPNPGARGIVTARALIDEFQFAKALAVIGDTLKEPGLETATLISLYELEGIAHATSGASTAAKESFARLLTLDPAHPMPNELPPKVRTLYFGARTVAQREALELVAEPPTRVDAVIESLSVTVKTSSLLPATAVRFTVSVDDGPSTTTLVPLDGAHRPGVKVHGAKVKWWADLLGPHEAVLRSVEREELPPAEDLVKKVPVSVSQAPSPSPGSWVKPAGVAVGIGGLVGVTIGAVLGAQSADARAKIAGAATDGNGVVIGLTQVEAARLDATARGGLAANVLMISGGALTATGLLMFLLGPEDPAPVSVSMGPGGVTAAGRF
ncbi:MAG: hypothetical protein Q8L48_39565 [Archangium sp.]|nr:hypothetical protein [Archangium sp.]